jgi:protein SCO1
MNKNSQKLTGLWVLLITVIMVATGAWISRQISSKTQVATVSESSAITLLSTTRALPKLKMVDQNTQTFTQMDFKGHWSLVFMGFTNCGHVCPTAMAEIRMIHDGVNEPLRVVFISVDPERDTPEIIGQFVESFDESFIGITGTHIEIEKLAAALSAPYFVDNSGGSYIVDHSAALFLVDPTASLAGVITQPLEIDTIIEELNLFL